MRNKGIIVFAFVFVVLFVIDIATKMLTDGKAMEFLPGVISFASYRNTGIAFSMFSNAGLWLNIVTGALTVAALCVWYFLGRRDTFACVAFAVFIAGAVGNLYDRIAHGYVRDFIVTEFLPTFPVFNFADICLTIGTILVGAYFMKASLVGGKNA